MPPTGWVTRASHFPSEPQCLFIAFQSLEFYPREQGRKGHTGTRRSLALASRRILLSLVGEYLRDALPSSRLTRPPRANYVRSRSSQAYPTRQVRVLGLAPGSRPPPVGLPSPPPHTPPPPSSPHRPPTRAAHAPSIKRVFIKVGLRPESSVRWPQQQVAK